MYVPQCIKMFKIKFLIKLSSQFDMLHIFKTDLNAIFIWAMVNFCYSQINFYRFYGLCTEILGFVLGIMV